MCSVDIAGPVYLFYRNLLCSSRLHLFDQNTEEKHFVFLQFKINDLYLNVMYFCDAQLCFQHRSSSLQCHMIFRNHSYDDLLRIKL